MINFSKETNTLQFASFKVKIQIEEVLFLINCNAGAACGMRYRSKQPVNGCSIPDAGKETPFGLKTLSSVKGDIMFRSAGEKMGKGNSVTKEKTLFLYTLFQKFVTQTI